MKRFWTNITLVAFWGLSVQFSRWCMIRKTQNRAYICRERKANVNLNSKFLGCNSEACVVAWPRVDVQSEHIFSLLDRRFAGCTGTVAKIGYMSTLTLLKFQREATQFWLSSNCQSVSMFQCTRHCHSIGWRRVHWGSVNLKNRDSLLWNCLKNSIITFHFQSNLIKIAVSRRISRHYH